MGTILGLIIFVLDIWAIVQTIQSPVSTGNKVLWVLVIFILPLIGLILWYFMGPKRLPA